MSAASHNLPLQLTSFVGRERETAAVRGLLATERLVTLVGVGGCGKTRLALEAAGGLVDQYEDDVWAIELAGLADPERLPQALAERLEIRELPGESLTATITKVLRNRRLLIVLDNCEHLAASCATLTHHLLRACPNLRVLATSQHALGVAGEAVWQTPPLSAPDSECPMPLDELERFEAVRLFCERARSARRSFELAEDNAAAIVQICHALDGLPLAIELAAARTRALSPDQIAARLDDRFRLLTTRSATALPRHRALRTTLAWSYDLLDEREQVLLRRLAIYPSDFSLPAVEAVCGGGSLAGADLLDLLTQLIDKSLVVMRDQHGTARYRLLSTVRAYAREQLDAAGELHDLQQRHAAYFVQFAEVHEPLLAGQQRIATLELLDQDHDNLRAALDWSLEAAAQDARALDAHLRLVNSLWWFWFYRGHWAEGRDRYEVARTIAGLAGRPDVRARLINRAGVLAWAQGDFAVARARLGDSIRILRDHDDEAELALGLGFLSTVELQDGDIEAARRWGEECADIYRRLGSHWGYGIALANLGDITRIEGDLERSYRLSQQGVALVRQTNDRWALSMPVRNLAATATQMGRLDEARALIQESLALAQVLGEKWFLSRGLEEMASVLCKQGRFTRSARLFGAAEALRGTVGASVVPASRREYDAAVSELRRALKPRAFERAWAAGKALSLEDALAEALDPPGSAGSSTTPALAPLTRREREVAVLVSRGLTNRDIARELFIAEGTAANHVKHILRKLGFHSRAQVAAWTTEQLTQAVIQE